MSFLVEHLAGNAKGRFPVWMMRQAGRYLESYRSIREKHSFWDMVTRPELACEVSLMPIKELPVDAIILFSDILTIPYGLGIDIRLRENIGPCVEKPLRNLSDFEIFSEFVPLHHTAFVSETLLAIRNQLPSDTCLIGFAGAPWTVACYLVEGKSSRSFEQIKSWAYEKPETLLESLRKVADATFLYLESQVRSGAEVLQVFDTWCSAVPGDFFETYLGILRDLCGRLQDLGVPIIYFAKNVSHRLSLLSTLPVRVLGIDDSITLLEAERLTRGVCSLQGNLDPVILLGEPSTVRRYTRDLVEQARHLKCPPILNLGHGILPNTRLASARAFVEEVKNAWV